MSYSKTFIHDYFKENIINLTDDFFNTEYEGLCFEFKHQTYHTRLAKKTPKKKGYFLAMWTKNQDALNVAYSVDYDLDYLIVLIKDGSLEGFFKFPKSILIDKGILSNDHQKGKMALRVYAPWNQELNESAMKTKKWQSSYFTLTNPQTNV